MESNWDEDSEPTRIDTESDNELSLFREQQSKKGQRIKLFFPIRSIKNENPILKIEFIDSEQNIDSNENILQKVCGVFPLQPATQSFRFGPEVRKVQLFFVPIISEMYNLFFIEKAKKFRDRIAHRL